MYMNHGNRLCSASAFKLIKRTDYMLKSLICTSDMHTQSGMSGLNVDFDDTDVSPGADVDHECEQELYPGHIRTSTLQKCALAVASGVVLLRDPSRDDLLSALGETTGMAALKSLRSRMLSNSEGRIILQEKPVINKDTLDLNYLKTLPQQSFGNSYWKYLQLQGFDPDSRYPVQFVDDLDLGYVMLRYRQVHDFMHLLLNMPPNMMGEVAVKWVEYIQTGLPMCLLGGLLGPVRFGPKWRKDYITTYLPWAVTCARNSQLLMAVYYEKHWHTSLDELRDSLGITPPPCHTWRVY